VTRNEVGDGAAWYLATRLDADGLEALVGQLVDEAGVSPAAGAPKGVELVRRSAQDRSYLFAINHTEATATVLTSGHDLVADEAVGRSLTLAPGAVAVVRERG
jgi:beta-galactosidase